MPDLARLKAENPQWNIVDAIDAPGGGTWALGADGGVFALGGAPFFGTYTGLAPEQRQGERSFVRIEREGSGYRLISNRPGETYAFGAAPGQPSPATPPPPPSPPPAVDTTREGGKASVASTLQKYGLTFSTAEIDQLVNTFVSRGDAGFMLALRDMPQYKQRFPAMDALRQKGRAIDEGTYIAYERGVDELFGRYGIPKTFAEPADIAEFLSGDVSLTELGERVQGAAQMAFSSPVETRMELERLYGIGAGGLTAFWLDPDRATPELEKMALASQLGGASQRVGFGALTREEAERMATLGLTEREAAGGLSQLAQSQGLFGALPGSAEDDITREEQLGATFEDSAAARERIARRQRSRQATFEGGGGFAGGEGGISGLGA